MPASRPSASSRAENSAIRRDLPVARLADQAHDLSPAALHALERGQQLIELVGASDDRRREPERRQPAGRSRLGERAEQAMDDDRLGLAAQRQLAGRLEGEAMLA